MPEDAVTPVRSACGGLRGVQDDGGVRSRLAEHVLPIDGVIGFDDRKVDSSGRSLVVDLRNGAEDRSASELGVGPVRGAELARWLAGGDAGREDEKRSEAHEEGVEPTTPTVYGRGVMPFHHSCSGAEGWG